MLNGFFFDDKTMNANRFKSQEITSVDPCKRHVCDLQKCLCAQNFQEDRCKHCIAHLGSCCQKFGSKSFVCSGMKHLVSEDNQNETAQDLATKQSEPSVSGANVYGLINNITETMQKRAQNVYSSLYNSKTGE